MDFKKKTPFIEEKHSKTKNSDSHSSSEGGSHDSDSETINFDQILLNKLLFEAQSFYRSRERVLSLEKYTQALQLAEKMRNIEKIVLLKTNIAIISFENGDYKESKQTLEESLTLLNTTTKGEMIPELKLKILTSLCVINIVLNQFDKAREYGSKITNFLSSITTHSLKKSAMELVVFSLYKFLSFSSMQNISLDNIDEICTFSLFIHFHNNINNNNNIDQGVPLACFYSTLGLNRELNNDPQQALNYYLKALDVWKNCSEIGFVLITLKHLINLAPRAGLNVADTANFMKLYQKLLQADDFKGVNVEGLFKDYEQRIDTAKEITQNLRKLEEIILFEDTSAMKKSTMLNSMSISQDNVHNNENSSLEPFWKHALRLRLLKSLKMAKEILVKNPQKTANLAKSIANSNNSYSYLLAEGTDQILNTLTLLQEENNQLILDKLQSLAYTKEAVTQMRASINKIRKYMTFRIYTDAFKTMKRITNKKMVSEIKKSQITSFVSKAYRALLEGDYLVKCNISSNGRIRKYFKLEPSGKLLIATKEIYIDNPTKNRELDLREVEAVIYGKSTPTLLKLYNKPLENYNCFSLITKGKTIDFYCSDDQTHLWVVGLSKETKKRNPEAYCLEPGRLIWRGLRLRLTEKARKITEKQGIKPPKKEESFLKVLFVLFKAHRVIK